MNPPRVLNIRDKRADEAKREGRYVYIGRDASLRLPEALDWGNPFAQNTRTPAGRVRVIASYEAWMREWLAHPVRGARLRADILSLGDKDLVCHCAPKSCHGDVLVKLWHELLAEYGGL